MTEKLLTLRELSDETGVPVKTLYALCAPSGDLACVRSQLGAGAHRKTRGRIWIARSAWADWQRRHTATPAEESSTSVVSSRRTPARVLNLPGADRYVS